MPILRHQRLFHSQKGFTLIELMITLAIISILSTLLIPKFSNIQNKAKETHLKSTIHTLQLAIESYQLSKGNYPQSTQISTLINTLITNSELPQIPINPFTGQPSTDNDTSGKIQYTYNSETNKYSLSAYGQNGSTPIITITN